MPLVPVMLAIGILPMWLLWFPLALVQVIAGITGAVFLPLLAAALLGLPFSRSGREAEFRHNPLVTIGLALCLVFFGFMACQTVLTKIASLFASVTIS